MGLYINVEYGGDWWGEDGLTETAHETLGSLFRSLAGMRPKAGEPHRPWEALGRCTGKVYADVPGSPCMLCHEPKAAHEFSYPANPITTVMVEPGGMALQHYYQSEARQVGWVFVARNPEPTSRADEAVKDTGLREAWVTVYDAPPTITRTEHYTTFGGAK